MNVSETVFPPGPVETGITDETYFVGNDEFLLAVFGVELTEALPVLVSFVGNPATVPNKVWFGRVWQGNLDLTTDLTTDANNYFSLAVFKPDEAGRYRRQKARFHALHAVMLDDVGSKIPRERLTLQPSWLLETSPGNCQAGYLLREPLVGSEEAPRRAGLRPPLKRSVRFSRTPLSQRLPVWQML
jgi:hypothetical protein